MLLPGAMNRIALIGLSLGAILAFGGCKKDEAPATTKKPAAPATKPAANAPPPANANANAKGGDAEAGKRLFMTACANCHGPDGTGQMMRQMMPNIGNLTLPATHAKYDDAAFAELIKNGRGKMPAFGSVFQPEQIQQIIAYARTLKK